MNETNAHRPGDMTMMFSERTAAELTRAGWNPERRVDTTAWEEVLATSNYPLPVAVLDFLVEFGGLRLLDGGSSALHFDAGVATRGIDPLRVEDYAARVGTPLCPIGQADATYTTVFMDELGRAYSGRDRLLLKLGDSGLEAIDALITGGGEPVS